MKNQTSSASISRRSGFTLVELLIVISIIAILASFIFPITAAVNKKKILNRAGVEMIEIETAIMSYQQKLGHYPPDNRALPFQNQLYYELSGCRLDASGNYKSLDGSAQLNAAVLPALFGTSGFVNATKGAGGDEGQSAQSFLKVKQARALSVTDTNPVSTEYMALGSLLPGPRLHRDVSTSTDRLNPWRYVSTGATNNPTSFDLWIDVNVGKAVYRISNWSKQPLIVTGP